MWVSRVGFKWETRVPWMKSVQLWLFRAQTGLKSEFWTVYTVLLLLAFLMSSKWLGAGRYCKRHMKYFRRDSFRKYCPKPRRDSEDFLCSPCVSDCRSGYQWSLLLRFLNQSGKCPWLEEVLNPKVFALNYYCTLLYCGLYHLIWNCCGGMITTTVENKEPKDVENRKLKKLFNYFIKT